MTDTYCVGWPVPNSENTSTIHTNTAWCLTEEAAKQVRQGLRLNGFLQAVVYRIPQAPGQVPGNAVDLTAPSKENLK